MMPNRIQRKRTKDWRMPPNTVYVGRPTKWGNPCKVGMFRDYDAAAAVRDYRLWLERATQVRSFENTYGKPPSIDEIQAEMRDKDLVCWCPLDQPCHADVLLELANQ